METPLEVVAALIRDGDRFLACQRSPQKARGLLWEFLGGKVEPGETRRQALARECREELGVTVAVGEERMTLLHHYPDLTVRLTLLEAACARLENYYQALTTNVNAIQARLSSLIASRR